MDRALGGVANPTLLAMLPVSTLRRTLRAVRVGTDPDLRELQAGVFAGSPSTWKRSTCWQTQ